MDFLAKKKENVDFRLEHVGIDFSKALSEETKALKDTDITLEGQFAEYANSQHYMDASTYARQKANVYKGYHTLLESMLPPLEEEALHKAQIAEITRLNGALRTFKKELTEIEEDLQKAIKVYSDAFDNANHFMERNDYENLRKGTQYSKSLIEKLNFKMRLAHPSTTITTPNVLIWLQEKEKKWSSRIEEMEALGKRSDYLAEQEKFLNKMIQNLSIIRDKSSSKSGKEEENV